MDTRPGSPNMSGMSARTPEEAHALLVAAFNDGDPDALADVYEEEAALVIPPDGRQVSGLTAIQAALAPIFALAPSARIDVIDKLETDGLALTHTRWHMAVADGTEMNGGATVVTRRQPDGSWRIVLDDPLSAR